MSFDRKKSDIVRAFYAADKDGDGELDLFEYVSMFHDQVGKINVINSFYFTVCINVKDMSVRTPKQDH